MRYVVTVEGETFEIEVGREGRVWVDRQPYDVVPSAEISDLLLVYHEFSVHRCTSQAVLHSRAARVNMIPADQKLDSSRRVTPSLVFL